MPVLFQPPVNDVPVAAPAFTEYFPFESNLTRAFKAMLSCI